jgi:hypothetical protein
VGEQVQDGVFENRTAHRLAVRAGSEFARRRAGQIVAADCGVPTTATAAKTRRGLRGRVEAGKSGGGLSYGYDVVRKLDADGAPVTGERTINASEATVIRRVFEAFASGESPKAIARALNAEGVAGPRGKLWRDTAIRGHRQRGTGLLNNELYIGQLVWNRMRYVKDPQTGKRVSRLNDPSEWIRRDVP